MLLEPEAKWVLFLPRLDRRTPSLSSWHVCSLLSRHAVPWHQDFDPSVSIPEIRLANSRRRGEKVTHPSLVHFGLFHLGL